MVSPTESASAPLARDLMVALVRAGVTATCSSADKPRYGELAVDSNLPDVRIALGGPDDNAFTAAVLAEADPAYAEELKRQLDATGTARVWVPAARRWPRCGCPAPTCAACARCRCWSSPAATTSTAAVGRRRRRPRRREIAVDQEAPSELEPFEPRTVAVLNRGLPGFAVDTDGTLHLSLMRSCTGWPSGMWIDPPRRTAPDGSSFQLQHWTHTFDYALVSGDGDWRDADIPARSAEFSRPLLAVAENTRAAGGLPAWGSLLEIEPAGTVALGALKAAGNPIAPRQRPGRRPGRRCRDPAGRNMRRDHRRRVRSGLRRVSAAARVDLLEQPRMQAPRTRTG